jgi:secreted trypsin-like serine protease
LEMITLWTQLWPVLLVVSIRSEEIFEKRVQKRVIGGDYAPPEKFPWAISLRGDVHAEEASAVCGATLISDTWLLSAAHCFYTLDENEDVVDLRDPSLWHIRAGQIVVEHSYEKENHSVKNKFSIDLSTSEPPNEQISTPKEKVEETTESAGCQELQRKTFQAVEKAQKCWLKLLELLSNPDELSKMRRYRLLCKSLYQKMKKLANKLEECYEREGDDSDVPMSVSSKEAAVPNEDVYQHYHVKHIILHQKYVPEDLEYDIALMKLDKPLPLHQLKGVAAINLPSVKRPSQYPPLGKECVIVGWGCTMAKGQPNEKAKYANLQVISNARCNKVYSYAAGLNDDHEFCAGFMNRRVGVCPGDSGGGLVCQSGPTNWTVAGVVSATHAEKPGSFPGVFTRVSFFVNWIQSIMKKY